MSYDSTINTFRSRLDAGTAHRRRVEQRRRTASLGAVAVMLLLAAGLFAVRRSDSGPSVVTTAMTSAQRAVCDAFLDYVSTPRTPDEIDLTRTRWLDAVEDRARALDANDPLATHARRLAGGIGSDQYADAYNDLKLRCRELGHPDFNPVFVAAPIPDASPPAELLLDAEAQMFHATTTSPVPYNDIELGRDLSVVQIATTELDGYVVAWDFVTGTGQRRYCVATGTLTEGAALGARCSYTPGASFGSSEAITIYRSGLRDLEIETASNVATVVASRDGTRLVQHPVRNRVVLRWSTDRSAAPPEIRGYDAAGNLVACFPYNPSACQ